MTKVLVATEKPFAAEAVDKIRKVVESAGYELALLEKYTDKAQFLSAVADADALIVRSDIVDREVIEAAKNLKIVVRAGAGYNNLDLEAASEKGIVEENTPGQNSDAVAELAIGMMIYLARGGFNGKPGTELKGKKLGIHGYGNVGRRVAQIAKGMGMDVYVYAYKPSIEEEARKQGGITCLESVEDLYRTCNYISLNIPARVENKQAINYALLSLMPEQAVLVNTARAEVINEADLLKVMAEKPGFSYISDIAPDCAAEFEPYAGRYFFTPKKMGAQTVEANVNAGIAAAEQIVAFFEKGDTTFKVNK
ncbi:MAG: NAD(P)-dependent oxidoreductase [Anaerolineaceae bacterium]|jgi:D-3-phosphoglycerate dehydrogenase|nr:NAD(P)-dependent oxidoreductase [Anaerolineaceae bacterium]